MLTTSNMLPSVVYNDVNPSNISIVEITNDSYPMLEGPYDVWQEVTSYHYQFLILDSLYLQYVYYIELQCVDLLFYFVIPLLVDESNCCILKLSKI